MRSVAESQYLMVLKSSNVVVELFTRFIPESCGGGEFAFTRLFVFFRTDF